MMRVLIVEDDAGVAETVNICFTLGWPDAEALLAETGEEAVEMARLHDLDVVILDIGLPKLDGYGTLRQLREFTQVPVIMLTARDQEMEKVKGLELGADDYMTKPFRHIELLARVKAVLRRSASPPAGQERGVYRNTEEGLEIDFESRVVTRYGEPVDLAPLEYSLLYHLVSNKGKVLSHQTLLAKVWGREYVDQTDYLKVYIRRLRNKLKDRPPSPGLIHSERGVGYIFQARPAEHAKDSED